jgi:Ser/Thr protein kinase RdoA (MazF antagonist)
VGAAGTAGGRNRLHPLLTSRSQADYILSRDLVPQTLKDSFTGIIDELLKEIAIFFEDSEEIRIHGDCHGANIIYRPGESFYLIDFDDMVTGPPIQDIWMLLPGPVEESRLELSLFLEGYEMFRSFDRSCLKLVEPLRAMRFIHYMSWCAWQFVEDGETRVDESFGSYGYWQKEISDLEDQLKVIRRGD